MRYLSSVVPQGGTKDGCVTLQGRPNFFMDDTTLVLHLSRVNSLLKNAFFAGWSKMPGCKAPEILRSEAYLNVRRNDEG